METATIDSHLPIFSPQTNIPFLQNVLTHPQFVTGQVDTYFIDDNPSLTRQFQRSQNRAQKLLHYFANLLVNGPSTPLATGLRPAVGDAPVPEVPFGKSEHLNESQTVLVL